MITAEHANLLLEMLAAAIRPPDGYLRPKGEGLPSGKVIAAKVYAAALNGAGVTLADAEAAVVAYLAEPDPGQYPKPWPDPGKLIARTALGRAAGHLGSESDAEQAFADFTRRLTWFRGMRLQPDRNVPAQRFDDTDAYRDDAMFAAWASWPRGEAEPCATGNPISFDRARRAWLAVYRDTRKGQARDPEALRLTASTQRLLGVSS